MPKTSPRPAPPLDLAVSTPTPPVVRPRGVRLPYLPWLVAAAGGAAACLFLGWVVVGAIAAAAWVGAPELRPAEIVDAVSRLWLGVHGVPFELLGVRAGLIPLGLAAVVAAGLAAVARRAALQASGDRAGSPRWVLSAAAACVAAYTLLAMLLGTIVGTPGEAVAAGGGALALSALGAAVGVLPLLRERLLGRLPGWASAARSAARVAAGGFALAGVLALAVAVLSHRGQIAALQAALAPDALGSALLVVAYLAYLPNLVLWAASYALGAGLSVGTGTLLTPTASVLGLLPGVPLAGALPAVPPAAGWLWWASGPLAGALAGLAFARRARADGVRPAPPVWAAAAGAAVALGGLGWAAASWVARGDLGAGRLVGLGPRFPELLGLAAGPPALAAAAVAAGAALWLGRRRAAEPGEASGGADDEGEATVAYRPGDEASGDAQARRPFGL